MDTLNKFVRYHFFIALWIIVLCVWWFFPPVHAAEIDQRKAEYIYHVMEYVRWPSAPKLNVCLFGPDPFGSVLDQAGQGKTIKGRPIHIKRITAIEERFGCHAIYFSPKLGLGAIQEQLKNVPKGVLTMSDKKNFALNGGMIELVTKNAKVIFNINHTQAKLASVRISSDLLKIAEHLY